MLWKRNKQAQVLQTKYRSKILDATDKTGYHSTFTYS